MKLDQPLFPERQYLLDQPRTVLCRLPRGLSWEVEPTDPVEITKQVQFGLMKSMSQIFVHQKYLERLKTSTVKSHGAPIIALTRMMLLRAGGPDSVNP